MNRSHINLRQAATTILTAVLCVMLYILILSALYGCTTTEYVTVPEVHEHYHHSTDTIHQKDSVIHEKQTTIMQLDSAEMAKYGIQLKAAERAWLIRTTELERQIENLMRLSATRDTVHDSVPVPCPVIEEVPAQLSWWQETMMRLGYIFLFIMAGSVVWMIIKKKS